MALPIAKILMAVPWGKVIENAPLLVNQAQQLWSASSRRKSPNDESSSPSVDPEALARRIATLERNNEDLRAQLSQTNALIVELTEQNAVLIGRVERNRALLYMASATALLALVGVIWLAQA
ncbi:hypothetical protein [Sphingomonas sp. C3-2]|uniref:hypothetical protein n=1 Tax=Sphingomonas sp. C3-2 TaxID=3062169 RepID=UPI00294B136F|nr:hypothetical protein [Sphingomonas sp. C3-2]WOK36673.1 hypothetical protein QYC26_00255 [Sphingomonas sp. C3-2]